LRWVRDGRFSGTPRSIPVDADVFINIRPADSLAVPDDLPVRALLGCGIHKAPRPREGYPDDSTIRQVRNNSLVCDIH
jgi:hypothetical protein